MRFLQGAHLNQGTGELSHPQYWALQTGSQCRWEAELEGPASKVPSSSVIGYNPVKGHAHPVSDELNMHSFLFPPR